MAVREREREGAGERGKRAVGARGLLGWHGRNGPSGGSGTVCLEGKREREGVGDLGRAGWSAGRVVDEPLPGSLSFSISFPLFYFKPNSNYLNSTLALKQIKQCTSMNATTSLNQEKI